MTYTYYIESNLFDSPIYRLFLENLIAKRALCIWTLWLDMLFDAMFTYDAFTIWICALKELINWNFFTLLAQNTGQKLLTFTDISFVDQESFS